MLVTSLHCALAYIANSYIFLHSYVPVRQEYDVVGTRWTILYLSIIAVECTDVNSATSGFEDLSSFLEIPSH